MDTDAPIACSLSSDELPQRLAELEAMKLNAALEL